MFGLRLHRKRRDANAPAMPDGKLPGDFAAHFKTHIAPKTRGFEERRKKALSQFKFRAAMAALGLVVGVATGLFYVAQTGGQDAQFVIFAGFAALAAMGSWASRPIRKYHEDVQGEIFPLVFSFFGSDFAYAAQPPINVKSLEPSGIIPYFETEYAQDHVRGTYRGVGIELFQARMTKTEGSGKNRRTVEVFQGFYILLGAHKKFKGRTVLQRDYGVIGNFMARTFNRLERVALEDPEFEKRFEVFATDQVEARYLLTTSFMERMLAMTRLFPKSPIQASFYESRLLLSVETGDTLFALPSLFKPVTFERECAVILAQMKIIFQIIETLKLNEKTGL